MHSLILEMVANPAFDSVIPNITAAAAPEKLKAEFTNPLYDENESLSKSFVVVYPIKHRICVNGLLPSPPLRNNHIPGPP